MQRPDLISLAWRALPWICLATPALLLTRGLGRSHPYHTFLICGLAQAGLALCGWQRLRQGPVARGWVLLSVLALVFLNLGAVLGTISPLSEPHLALYHHRLGAGFAILGGLCAALPLLVWPFLVHLWNREVEGVAEIPVPPSRWSPALVLATTLIFHLGLFFALGSPIVQGDSICNLWEPPLLGFGMITHHPPLYSQTVELFAPWEGDPRPGLSALILIQHLLVVLVALGIERAGRFLSGRAWVGCLAGILVGVDTSWNLYAQSVMSEAMASSICMFSALCILEAARRKRATRWLIAAGLLAGIATLTRQAMQAWFGVGVIWLTGFSALRPRRSTCAALALAAILPVSGMIYYNYVFKGRASLTGALGRNLIYRALVDMPELSDPDAPPGDEWERARQLAWAQRHFCYSGPYTALKEGMGWNDEQINKAFVRFYFEQMRRHPAQFTKVTADYFFQLLLARNSIEQLGFPIHNLALPDSTWDLPEFKEATPAVKFFDSFDISAQPPWLILAALAPLLAWGHARRASFLALGGFTYFVLLAAMVEVPGARYRLSGVPLVYLAGCLSLAGGYARLERLWKKSPDDATEPDSSAGEAS